MNNRIKLIRKEKKLSQANFGKKLDVTGNYIYLLESGQKEPSNRLIRDICIQFNVNEEWLRTGKGEMFIQLSRNDEISAFINEILSSETDTFKKRLIAVLSQLDDNDWEVLERFALSLSPAQEDDFDIEAEVESYRQELLAERAAEGKRQVSTDSDENIG